MLRDKFSHEQFLGQDQNSFLGGRGKVSHNETLLRIQITLTLFPKCVK